MVKASAAGCQTPPAKVYGPQKDATLNLFYFLAAL
jgi:hypothetical protein